MIKSTKSIAEVKQSVLNLKEKPVKVTLNLGRNKLVHFKAKLSGVYPALFTVLPLDDFKGKTAYSYSEFMCGKVKLKEINTNSQTIN